MPVLDRMIIKYGGSSLDLELDTARNKEHPITSAGAALRMIARQRAVIVMPGGGPTNELIKAAQENYRRFRAAKDRSDPLRPLSKQVLLINATLLHMAWGGQLFDPEQPYARRKLRRLSSQKGLSVVPYPPDAIVASDSRLEFKNSDTLALAIAEELKIETVVFLKDADGLFRFDPKWAFRENKLRRVPQPRVPDGFSRAELNRPPRYYSSLTAEEALKLVWRKGACDGREDHLIETAALEYLTACVHVARIIIGQVTHARTILRHLTTDAIHPSEESRYSIIHKGPPQ